MLNVAAAVAGGHFLRETLDQVQRNAPTLHQNKGEIACKLSVRILAASVPGLPDPGVFSRQRPYLQVSLGSCEKETEPADFDADAAGRTKASASSGDCPWCFDECLTFSPKLDDISGPGLKFRLRAQSDLQFGPLHIASKPEDVGEATMDMQRRVLPACVQEQHHTDRPSIWSSPLILLPLMHVRGGILGAECRLGEAVAHVTLLLSLDVNPESILAAMKPTTMRIEQKFKEQADEVTQWLHSLPSAAPTVPSCCQPRPGDFDPLDVDAAVARAAVRAWTVGKVKAPLAGPDASPDEWVCTIGPNGQKYWHNLALGPAPWDDEIPDLGSPQSPSLPCPDERPDGWVYMEGADGRRFWHHADLGPAPWDQAASTTVDI
eukprot:TRINITY_DN92063_c0_g1_i1.p1 TRINITY_DN92063_c0_g1~~TRINITY_DN92063_c0_g1_i1.p1  ORF type:complete len:377 (-),score=46.49 TRINITY_DN92063_c0_g1_i1:83-1213(-)